MRTDPEISPCGGIIGLGVVGSVFIFGTKVYGATNWISIAEFGFQLVCLRRLLAAELEAVGNNASRLVIAFYLDEFLL